MAKEYQFNWKNKVPEILLNGDTFDRYDDETNILDLSCQVRFEEYGFYLVWEPKNKDAGLLDITQIWETRPSGTIKDARVLFDLEQRGLKESVETRTVWITYGQDLVNVNSLYLIAKSGQVAKEWRQAINDFVRMYKFRHACPMHCLQKHWRSLCLATNERSRIPLRNIVKTFASGKPERMVHKCLTDLGLAGDKEREDLEVQLFTFEKFLRLYHKICPRTDVQELFVKLSGQKEYLTKERLTHFLNDEQRDPRLNEILFPFFDSERVKQLIAKYETDESYIAQGKMSGDGFFRFLMSYENSPVFLDRTDLYQEMDQPLCHYYINSSHNTYLTGRQYGGKSSIEIYRQVLLSGCRCIELDCWDGTGENKGEPIITHGKAMCTDVFFRDVLYQIRDTAFMRSDFPVILSFENHCSKSNQLKMAKYCMEILGDMLLTKPLDDYPLEQSVLLPSPNRLKRKILIKNKRLKADVEKHQLEQFLREGKLDEDEELNETPEVINEDVVSPPNLLLKCCDEICDELGVVLTDDEENLSTEDLHNSDPLECSSRNTLSSFPATPRNKNSGRKSRNSLPRNPLEARASSVLHSTFSSGDIGKNSIGKQHLTVRQTGEGGGLGFAIASALGIERMTSSCSLNRGNSSSALTKKTSTSPSSTSPTACSNYSSGENSSTLRTTSSVRFPFRNVSSSLRLTTSGPPSSITCSPPPSSTRYSILAAAVAATSTGSGATTSGLFPTLTKLSSANSSGDLQLSASDQIPATEQDVLAAVAAAAAAAASVSPSNGQQSSGIGSEQQSFSSTPPLISQLPQSSSGGGDTVISSVDLKEDEAHPELKQSNFMSKLKPLGFTKKSQQQQQQQQQLAAWEQQYLEASDSCSTSGIIDSTTNTSNSPVATATNSISSTFNNFSQSTSYNSAGSSTGSGFLASIGRSEKRSFRRSSNASDHQQLYAAALLDAVPKRNSSQRASKSKKPILTKEEEERIFAEYNYTGATTNIHPLLSSLINYTHPVKFSGFDIAESNDLHFHMSSFSESTGLGYLKQSASEFVNYNKRQLSRIYPKGARVDSSNFLPQIFWNAGCQMVSLNFQTPDVCMQLNQGKFDYNGQCGYLLKPDFMRRPDRSFDPFSESPVDGVIAAHCSVKIISGHFLCDRKVGTYVEVEMYGLPTDTIRKEHRTRTVPANGLNPIYNDDPFVFRKVVLPELAVLRFAVYDESGKQLGQRILPLDGLQSGYRHISLRTESNMTMTLSTLFVHLVLKTYVPDELSGLVDALADPRAYVSAQEKRKEALHHMGVDDSDIVEVIPALTSGMSSSGGSGNAVVAFKQISQKRGAELSASSSSLLARQQKQNGTAHNFSDGRSSASQSPGPGGSSKENALGFSQKPSNENLLLVNPENKFKKTVSILKNSWCTLTSSTIGNKLCEQFPNTEFLQNSIEFSNRSLIQDSGLFIENSGTSLLWSHDTIEPKFSSFRIRKGSDSCTTSNLAPQPLIRAASTRAPVSRQMSPLPLAYHTTSVIGSGLGSIMLRRNLEVENININDLRKDKSFQKQVKKQQKDIEEMKKRHQKQREVIQKQQQTNVDKLMIDNQKMSTKKRNNVSSSNPAGNRHSSLSGRTSDPVDQLHTPINEKKFSNVTPLEKVNDKKIRDLVSNQTDEWSKLIRNQESEEFELRKKQIQEEFDLLKKLLLDAQKQQMVTLRMKFETENKELKQSQTKKSMDDTKAIQQEKGIKTKAERDRRIKELNEKNVKMFVEERKRLATKCRRHEEQLEKRHLEQNEALDKEIAKAIEQEEMNHRELLLASRPESIV